MNSVKICEELSYEIFETAALKIRDKLLAKMAPHFVKKQMI